MIKLSCIRYSQRCGFGFVLNFADNASETRLNPDDGNDDDDDLHSVKFYISTIDAQSIRKPSARCWNHFTATNLRSASLNFWRLMSK